MNYQKINISIKLCALLSFISVAYNYWLPDEAGFYLLLAPYVVIYFLSNNNQNIKVTILRGIPAVLTFLLVPVLLFGIESDAQAAIAVMYVLMIQLATISVAELINLFSFNK